MHSGYVFFGFGVLFMCALYTVLRSPPRSEWRFASTATTATIFVLAQLFILDSRMLSSTSSSGGILGLSYIPHEIECLALGMLVTLGAIQMSLAKKNKQQKTRLV